MNKRVHQIAKECGLQSKDVLERLRAAGVDVKAASSNVDEEVALKVLGNGDGAATASKAPVATGAAPPVPKPVGDGASAQRQAPAPAEAGPVAQSASPATARPDHKQRPTRDSLQGERAPGAAGGRRRVVIDSQASRRAPGGGGPQGSQLPRRQRRGRRRRGVYDEEGEARPAAQTAVADRPASPGNPGATVKDVAEYLDVAV